MEIEKKRKEKEKKNLNRMRSLGEPRKRKWNLVFVSLA